MATIVIVEDNPDNMKLFRTLLSLRGHAITSLSSGEGLAAALAANPPDLVLMDIQLPGKDGFALLADIRGSAQKELRVVALTAHAMAGDHDRAIAAGFDGYITKPVDIREFPDQVARALSGDALSR